MKLSKNLTNILVLGGLTLSLVIFGLRISETQVSAQGGGASALNLLDTSGGQIHRFELWPKDVNIPAVYPALTQPASLIGQGVTTFRSYGTAIMNKVIAYNDSFFNQLFVGFSTFPTGGGGTHYDIGLDTGVKLFVNGRIQLKTFADSSAPAFRKLCADDFGVLKIDCGHPGFNADGTVVGSFEGGPGGPGGPGTIGGGAGGDDGRGGSGLPGRGGN